MINRKGNTNFTNQALTQQLLLQTNGNVPLFQMNSAVVQQHYFTPVEANIPVKKIYKHRPIPITDKIDGDGTRGLGLGLDIREGVSVAESALRTLDGFNLLTASGVGFPDDSLQANVVGQRYGYAVEEDFRFFTKLEFLDASENNLNFNNFHSLPILKELRLVCNGITHIDEVIGFERLLVLDLSYNKLSTRSFQNLAFIPNLMELDVSGNSLKALPYDMSKFVALRRLIAENNKFDDNYSFEKLSKIPGLEHCDLAYNYLSKFPAKACDGEGFKYLKSLDISFNYFTEEEDAKPIIKMPRLYFLYLYGNPVLGPTGEDPMKMYIEDLENECLDYRQSKGLNLLQIMTDIPHKRKLKPGKVLGRQSHYQDFEVKQVDLEKEKSVKAWREDGNQTLRADMEKSLAANVNTVLGNRATSITNANPIPDMTFMTTGLEEGEDDWAFTVADNVMSRVAAEMGLGHSHELDLLEQTAALKTIFATQNQRSVEAIPDGLFSSKMGEIQNLVDPTMSVKVAVKALRFAINHPLSDYNVIPKVGASMNGIARPTVLSQSRKTSKLAVKEVIDPEHVVVPEKKQSMFGSSKKAPKGAEKTYLQIESVLDKLNNNTDDITTRPCGHGMNIKENLNVLKAFPRPNKVMKGLLDTVNGIVDQLE